VRYEGEGSDGGEEGDAHGGLAQRRVGGAGEQGEEGGGGCAPGKEGRPGHHQDDVTAKGGATRIHNMPGPSVRRCIVLDVVGVPREPGPTGRVVFTRCTPGGRVPGLALEMTRPRGGAGVR
jgi:hypothetical protein